MLFFTDPTRRNFVFNTIATVGTAASAVNFHEVIDAIFSKIQMATMNDPNIYRIVPSRLYVPLSPQDLVEARKELAKLRGLTLADDNFSSRIDAPRFSSTDYASH